MLSLCVSLPDIDNPGLFSHVPVTVQVLDMNDNPPEISTDEEVIVCENSRPGQVRDTDPLSSHFYVCFSLHLLCFKLIYVPESSPELLFPSALSACLLRAEQ